MTMTRKRVKALEYDYPMPMKKNQKVKIYEEVFIAGGGQSTEAEARTTLEKHKKEYCTEKGWYCEGGIHEGVFRDVDSRWYAYRHVAKYS